MSFNKGKIIIRQVLAITLIFSLMLVVPLIAAVITPVSKVFNTEVVSASEKAEKKEAVEAVASKKEEGKEEGKKAEYPPAPKLKEKDYPKIKGYNSRISVWIVAQIHLFFAAFVLAVPIFVLVI